VKLLWRSHKEEEEEEKRRKKEKNEALHPCAVIGVRAELNC
jgi:hypothetical protein